MQNRRNKKEKTFWQRILYSQLVIAVGIAFIILFSVGISKRMTRQRQLDKKIEKLNTEISRLEQDNKDFNKLITYFDSNDYLETEARLKLGLKKKGEQLAIISDRYKIEELKKSETSRIYQPAQPNEKSNPAKWWGYFFKISKL